MHLVPLFFCKKHKGTVLLIKHIRNSPSEIYEDNFGVSTAWPGNGNSQKVLFSAIKIIVLPNFYI